ncbi:MAG: hypothetical protein QNJ03_08695 [Dinoroseobacter sp.]|nr:hypothetical protein [Dinoroseobacter sp.]
MADVSIVLAQPKVSFKRFRRWESVARFPIWLRRRSERRILQCELDDLPERMKQDIGISLATSAGVTGSEN